MKMKEARNVREVFQQLLVVVFCVDRTGGQSEHVTNSYVRKTVREVTGWEWPGERLSSTRVPYGAA